MSSKASIEDLVRCRSFRCVLGGSRTDLGIATTFLASSFASKYCPTGMCSFQVFPYKYELTYRISDGYGSSLQHDPKRASQRPSEKRRHLDLTRTTSHFRRSTFQISLDRSCRHSRPIRRLRTDVRIEIHDAGTITEFCHSESVERNSVC